MFKSKTHFEQVPLEVVKKIVEEETNREQEAEPGRAIKTKKLEEQLFQAAGVLRPSGRS